MLLLSEQTTLNHAGLNPQSIATVGALMASRATIIAKPGGDGGQGAGSATGGSATLQTGLIYANTTIPAGNTVANTAALTGFSSICLLPGSFLQVGMVLFVKAWGYYSTAVVAPTLKLDVRVGGSTLIALTTGTFTLVAGTTNAGWSAEGQMHVTSIGATGTMQCEGVAEFSTAATAALTVNMANTGTFTVNANISRILSLGATWGAASASNTITLTNLSVRAEQAQTFS